MTSIDSLAWTRVALTRSPYPGARLDQRVEEHRVRIARDGRELARHAVDDLLRDLVRGEQRARARQQQVRPVRDELGALARCPVVEMERLDLGRDVVEADRLEQVAELGADERVAAEAEL